MGNGNLEGIMKIEHIFCIREFNSLGQNEGIGKTGLEGQIGHFEISAMKLFRGFGKCVTEC